MDEWRFGVNVAAFGFFVWSLIFLARWQEIKAGSMRPREPWKTFRKPVLPKGVPGPWDYWTNGIGDAVALQLVNIAAGALIFQYGPSGIVFLLCVVVGITIAFLWFRAATPMGRVQKNVDWWYEPQGARGSGEAAWLLGSAKVKIAVAGWIHLAYLAFQAGAAALGIWILFHGYFLSPYAFVGYAGAIGYGVTWYLDKKQGHFA